MKLLIYGSKEFASTVRELARHSGFEVAGMVDDYTAGLGILGGLKAVVRTHPPSDYGIAIAIGYNNLSARWAAWQNAKAAGYKAPPLIHPRAYVADTASIGDGAMVMAGALVDVHARVGELTVLWPAACINHDSRVGENTFICPNATICGDASVGSHTFIGAGAVVVDHVTAPPNSFIKAAERYTGKLT